MNTIIQQFEEKISLEVEEILKDVLTGEEKDISEVIKVIRNHIDDLGKNICKYIIETVDEAVKESSKRKKEWTIERKEERSLITEFGEIKYKRRYYKSKGDKGYEHLADRKLGIEKYQRMDRGLESEIVDLAADKSYAKTGEKVVNSLRITDQTVLNKIRKLEKIDNRELNNPDKRRKVKHLYVEADEDHVALQNGKNSVPKLVYVHEGKSKENGREKLKNKYCFSGVYNEAEDLWEEVTDYIYTNYDLDSIKKIYIAGDGASWIKKGLEWLPKSRYILDRYHLNKYVLKATGHAKKLRFKLWEGINHLDRMQLKKIFRELIEKTEKETKKTEIRKSRSYIYNNWAGIVNYYRDENAQGCSAEGHISHILADRLSSRPMGWSKMGVDQMARLRAFKFNGGDLKDLHELMLNKERESKKEEKILEVEAKVVNSKLKRKFAKKKENVPCINRGKETGLLNTIKSFV